ncbi:MAG: hypothetical protein K6G62_05400 [Eubacterium sp.]|nr:hypothetical protein [Eubacterium sp.]
MIRWYEKLYMDKKVSKHPKRAMRRVEAKKLWKNYFALTLAGNPDNLFEIIETREMFFRHNRQRELYIFGLASSKKNAIKILRDIFEEASVREEFDPRAMFERKNFHGRKEGKKKKR